MRAGLAGSALLVVMALAGMAPQASAAGAAKVATRMAPDARAAGAAGPARQTALRAGVRGSSAQFTSRNWDGYITYASDEGTDFNVVKATWVQPAVTCPQPNAWTVFWVGLDGWWNDTVEQGGSSAECVNGVPQYATWWEMFPTNAITTVFSISAGNKITARVTYKPATTTFVISVKDITTGRSFTEHEQCASDITCDRSSADVIAEDVGEFGGSSFFPLADYGTMGFRGASVTDTAGHSGTITGSNWLNAAVTESAGGITYASVSALDRTGNGFRATWQHA
jgi:hypothetical protein